MAPGPGRRHADPEPAGELGVADRLEGAHLLVAGLHELRVGLGPAPGREQAVDAVAREGEHLLHAPLAQPCRAGSRRPWSMTCVPPGVRGGGRPRCGLAIGVERPVRQAVRGPGGDRHDRQGRVRAALGGQHAAVGDVEVGHREAAAVGVDDAVLLAAAIRAPPTRWAKRSMVITSSAPAARRMSSMTPLGGPHQRRVVVALGVGEVRDGQAVAVGLLRERHPVVRLRQELAQGAQAGPVHVVAHVVAQGRAPVALGGDVLGPGDRQRRDGLDGEPALVGLGRVGLVELLGADLGRRRLVHAHLGVEPARRSAARPAPSGSGRPGRSRCTARRGTASRRS